jgi:hypothetical protein
MPRGIRNVPPNPNVGPSAPTPRHRKRKYTRKIVGMAPLATAHDTSRGGRNQSFGFTQEDIKALSVMKRRGATWQTLNAIYGLL